jgi:hypothetical protein
VTIWRTRSCAAWQRFTNGRTKTWEVVQRRQRTQAEDLVVLLEGMVDILVDQSDETTIANSIRKWLAPKGDLEPLRESCAAVRAVSGGNYHE